jgi:hypothetical protein
MLSFNDCNVNTNGLIQFKDLALNPSNFSFPYFSNQIISGLIVTHPDAGDFLTCSNTAGILQVDAIKYNINALSATCTANASINPRIDLVCIKYDTNGFVIVEGTPAASPVPPALPANHYVLGFLSHIAGSNSLGGVVYSINTNIPTMPAGFLKSNGEFIESENVTFNIPNPTTPSSTIYSDGTSWIESTNFLNANTATSFFGDYTDPGFPTGVGIRFLYLGSLGCLCVGTVTGAVWNTPAGQNSLSVGLDVYNDAQNSLSVGNQIFNDSSTQNSFILGDSINTGGSIASSIISGTGHSLNAGSFSNNSIVTGVTLNLNTGNLTNSIIANTGVVNPALSITNTITCLNNSNFDSLTNCIIAGGNVAGSGNITNSIAFFESTNTNSSYSLMNTRGSSYNVDSSLMLGNNLNTFNFPLNSYQNCIISIGNASNPLTIQNNNIFYQGTVTSITSVLPEYVFNFGNDNNYSGTGNYVGSLLCKELEHSDTNQLLRVAIGLQNNDLSPSFLNCDLTTYAQRIKLNGFLIDKVTVNPGSYTMDVARLTTSGLNDDSFIIFTAGSDTITMDINAPIGATFTIFSISGTNEIYAGAGETINGAASVAFTTPYTAKTVKKYNSNSWIWY